MTRKIIRFLKYNEITNNDNIDDIIYKIYQEHDDISIDEIRNIVNNYLLQLDDSDNSYSCQETIEDSEEDNIEHRQRWIERIEKLRNKPQPEQRSEEWYKLRANMFTASSDIANILGMGYEKGPAVYKHLMLKKNGYDLKGFVGNDATKWGQKYENIICQVYSERNDTIIEEFGLIQHDEHYFIGASPDGIGVSGKNTGIMLEIKCPYRRIITGIPKDYYLVQMLTQLEVCDLDFCDFCECTINEYKTREDFLKDSLLEDVNKTANCMEKGIIGEFKHRNKYDTLQYCYPPLELNPDEKKQWIDQYAIDNEKNLIFHQYIYWKIDVYSCVRIKRDPKWWKESFPKIEKAWNCLLYTSDAADE
jgi:putative phage-type endonuclease